MGRPTRVALGEVVGAHGLRGEVRVRVFGDGPDNLLQAPWLALGAGPDDEALEPIEVIAAEPGARGEMRLRLPGITTREGAAALTGLLILGEVEHLERLPDGEYYGYEWVGCRVEDQDGRPVGTVRAIWDTGAHDVLVVEDETGREILLPIADALLREVDVEAGRIAMEVAPGLLDPD